MTHSSTYGFCWHQIQLAGVSSCGARAQTRQWVGPHIWSTLDGSKDTSHLRQRCWCWSPLRLFDSRRRTPTPQRTTHSSIRPEPRLPATADSTGETSAEALEDELKIIMDETNLKSEAGQEALFLSPSSFMQWDSLTGQLAGSATLAFLLLQLPQIILNAQNLMSGNKIALFAVPWMVFTTGFFSYSHLIFRGADFHYIVCFLPESRIGMQGQLTGLLGNLSLLSYFAKKRESGAMIVQAVGVISTFVVLLQLTVAGSMPFSAFTATATAVGLGLVLNFLNFKSLLNSEIWKIWEDAITIGGLSVLPQVMWSTFDAVLPPSVLPGVTAVVTAVTLVILQRSKKLPPSAASIVGGLSAWTATLLFMWAPVAQMWTNYLNPANIQGLSVFTVLLAMVGNGLLLPRALFTRDIMWFTGASWGTLVQGWGVLLTMYINKCIGNTVFWGASGALAVWLGMMVWKDANAYSSPSPLSPLVELVSKTTRLPTKDE